ncbi:hypothetical protein, partial [Pseudomonas aeruginosa]|uniref:hypothetical protein n=1 Tax=Pseudomonas aeruginosa TaxID=287 RepID=UPI001CA5901F
YELQPETYLLKFWGFTKNREATFLEHARDLKDALTNWTRSEKAETAEQLTELFLLEQFYKCTGAEMTLTIKEKNPKTLQEAAEMADLRLSLIRGCGSAQRSEAGNKGRDA